jgi:hypothetical protein
MARSTTNPATPSSDVRSEEAPGVRTEAEVVADAQAAADAAADTTPPGATGNPAGPDVDVPDEEDRDRLVHYLRESDGTVQSVNPGTPEHGILAGSGDWSETSRAKARKFEPRRFVRAGGNG